MTTPVADGHLGWTDRNLTGRQGETARHTVGSKRRPIPSPLQASESVLSTASADASNAPHRRRPPNDSSSISRAAQSSSSGAVPTAATIAPASNQSGDRVRAPNPAKRVAVDPARDDLRSAVTRDALREQAEQVPPSNQPTDQTSPPTSPNMNSFSKHPAASRADPRPIMPRNASIDSTASTTSSASATPRVNGTANYRVSQESNGPEDVAALIAAAGSPEGAIQKLINDKNQAASHNAQLWRLVEKQRAMILGLNKDLERSLKEKEKYRRKLKDELVQSQSAPLLTTATQQLDELVQREESQSPAVAEDAATTAASVSMRDVSIDSRKVSDTSDVASMGLGRSDTPQDNSNAPSSILPATPQSANSANAPPRDIEVIPPTTQQSKAQAQAFVERVPAQTPPVSPRLHDLAQQGHQKSGSTSSVGSQPASVASFSNLKNQASRKAPPAPLDLSSQKNTPPQPAASVTNNIIDPSDSEYEDDPDSARADRLARGRRKTREEDDHEREVVAQQEIKQRSRSMKEKKSKSKSKSQPPADVSGASSDLSDSTAVEPKVQGTTLEQFPQAPLYHHPNDVVRQRVLADRSAGLPKSSTAPSLLSPGLPMSPRPGDRPMNSPMPRAPNKVLNSIPMSPKSGMAGLPLSPRAPRQPLPMPPQTPLSLASPHLARAEGYQTSQPQSSSLANQVGTSPNGTPEQERPSMSGETIPMTPGEIYQGLVTEQYPDLLLPPNALPSIYVKTASSRMRPSRHSYIAPKSIDENPVFTLAVHERSDNKQLWCVEKTFAALAQIDEQLKAVCSFRERIPDKALFNGHAPAKIDARRVAIDMFFDRMLDSVMDDRPAKVVCKFLSTDAIGAAERGDYFGSVDIRPDTPINKRPQREGYLTKRGKNFGGWKARYFVLDGPNLKYFDNQGGAQLGSIKLQNAQIGKQSNNAQHPQEDEDNQFRHAFLILEPKKKDSSSLVRHVLCAESDEERDVWVDALLQYVDYSEDAEEIATKASAQAANIGAQPPRSPRLQKSLNDLRPRSRSREPTEAQPDQLRAVGYGDTVAGNAPVMGSTATGRKVDTPSPPHDANFGPAVDLPLASGNPNISGPTNLHVISNAGNWGMKPPPTPHGKDKKRSIFAGFRGRSSSDLNDKVGSPGLPPQDHYATGPPRAVFGVPLAEAVEFARPADVDTELPVVVYRCIEYLLAKNAIAEEGIFRLSGSSTVIKGLKDRFNTEGDVNLTADDKFYDVHAVAGLLKQYLRELPSSILTRDLHLEFLKCLDMHGHEKVVALNVMVDKLPSVNRALLEALSSFLLSVVNNSEINKMNVRNGKFIVLPLRLQLEC